ncbi:ABC transporter ATP-binding protein [Jeotgalicoccus meleagridis]|uniref:Teichoic acids export ATP-binding protein TagH n=1 Tax=Jeotgalicoccus meleagridis TaxID=2759181 RepID=A0A6V7RMT8_9STAP|nr:ABC transporter ATP-binding protein [Jeotgalicoccus meleagridis]CAD2079720.1 Teichoic acids export ATP-binding protein TagH [Jeotgalicoccus meleagridis]HIW38591.1 ABC transporter ATP-binding protein [Candidatus Jeotgalicoccus stercoravium]
MSYKVKVENVSKVFSTTSNKKKLWNFLLPFRNKDQEYYQALKNVSFEVEPGDSVGIVGLNGSGKSTLSNILGGVTSPSSGEVYVEGRPSLIAISAGLNFELTGKENIHMKCLMHGLSEKQIEERYDDIVQFSELEDFLDQPIKSYSSGMMSRLGFAIAVHTDPDVLIVDEALSVGDDTFANKCIDKMKSFREEGKTIFFVSHSIPQIQKMCNKAAWIHFGELKEYGDCIPVVGLYARFVRGYNIKPKHVQLRYKKAMIEGQRTNQAPKEEKDTTFGIGNGVLLSIFSVIIVIMGYLQAIQYL